MGSYLAPLIAFSPLIALLTIFVIFSLLLSRKVRIDGDKIVLKTLFKEEIIPLDSLTKVELTTVNLPQPMLALKVKSGEKWYLLYRDPHFTLNVLKPAFDLSLLQEIVRQSPSVEVSEELQSYLKTGKIADLYINRVTVRRGVVFLIVLMALIVILIAIYK